MTTIIDGRKIATEIRESLKEEVKTLTSKKGLVPGLAVIIIGEDPASQVYVNMKRKACEQIGLKSFYYPLPASTSKEELLKIISELNQNKEVNGILAQLPLPKHLDENIIINQIDPLKDVDCFHPANIGKIMLGDEDGFYPCTPYGCQELISRTVPDLKGKHLVVVGRSNIVGKPMINMMIQKNKRANCIVTACHTAAKDISYYTKQADILIVAAGRPKTITKEMVKKGVVIIDVGVNRITDPKNASKTKLVGDVDFEEVAPLSSAITPVPGGVGPMTITMLLKNTIKAFKIQHGINL